jgi:hypothetical protein
VYEYVGTGIDQPRRVDLDNSGTPASSCGGKFPEGNPAGNAVGHSISADGRVIFFTVFGGCGGPNPPADEIWARVDGTTSFDVSASQCSRTPPADPCNAAAKATYEGAATSGSRVFFSTTQQLVNDDTDNTKDVYACDIPAGSPAPSAAKANPCSGFRRISATETGAAAEVEDVLHVSDTGATVLFTAKGVLAENEDVLGEMAQAGDHNLYVWRQDSAHPDGRTSFVARLASNDLKTASARPQSTPDGRYLVFTTASQLAETDTDNAREVYRYDADTGELTRVSTNVFGIGGNGPFDSSISAGGAISDDGGKIVFTTAEGLSPADGNGELDVYLWAPARVSLISTGSVGGGINIRGVNAVIDGSGQDIYFNTPGALTPADGDDSADVYDARIGGGFSFAQKPICTGENCQLEPSLPRPIPASPANIPNGEGNASSVTRKASV